MISLSSAPCDMPQIAGMSRIIPRARTSFAGPFQEGRTLYIRIGQAAYNKRQMMSSGNILHPPMTRSA